MIESGEVNGPAERELPGPGDHPAKDVTGLKPSVTRPTLTRHQVRRARRAIAREVRTYGLCKGLPIRHAWRFDGYFWHHCRRCGAVS